VVAESPGEGIGGVGPYVKDGDIVSLNGSDAGCSSGPYVKDGDIVSLNGSDAGCSSGGSVAVDVGNGGSVEEAIGSMVFVLLCGNIKNQSFIYRKERALLMPRRIERVAFLAPRLTLPLPNGGARSAVNMFLREGSLFHRRCAARLWRMLTHLPSGR
jgi:hypothetical protein